MRFQRIGAIVLALLFVMLVFGCEQAGVRVTSISINQEMISAPIDIADFDLESLELMVNYSDGSKETVFVNVSMLTQEDLNKLQFMGSHVVRIRHLEQEIWVTIHLSDSVSTAILQSFYQNAVTNLGFTGSYLEWVTSVTGNSSLHIVKAEQNQDQQVIITLSNLQTVNLGVMGETFRVRFYGTNGELLKSVLVARGENVIPPASPTLTNYEFVRWSHSSQNVQSSLEIHPVFELVFINLPGLSKLDEWIISIDRLKNAQFDVNFSAIFSKPPQNMSAQRSRSLLSIYKQATAQSLDDPMNPEDYIPHPYWPTSFYHKGLYQMPEIVDGYHVITSQVSTYANNAINNLITSTNTITNAAREKADWAVDNLRAVDTWIESGETKYLLHYNAALDRVEYYVMTRFIGDQSLWFEQIYIYYNHKGEEVIERWTEHHWSKADQQGFKGLKAYYNSVAGRDFNYYMIWLDEAFEITGHRVFRGINLNEEGIYEYYENDIHMMSGEYGWYQFMPRIDEEQQSIQYEDYRPMHVFSPDGTTNVLSFYKMAQYYTVELYLPAFDGVQAILVQEGGMLNVNQDSESVRNMMINEGLTPLPNWWEMDRFNDNISTGFKTSLGTFIADPAVYHQDVALEKVNVHIFSEGIREYQNYSNYCGILKLRVRADSIDEMLQAIQNYLQMTGMMYEYGDMQGMFDEIKAFYESRSSIGARFNLMNPIMQGPQGAFKDYENYVLTHHFIEEYIGISTRLQQMLSEYPRMDYASMPPKNATNNLNFIDISKKMAGELSIDEGRLVTDNISATLSRNVLLQKNQYYTLFYALLMGGQNVCHRF